MISIHKSLCVLEKWKALFSIASLPLSCSVSFLPSCSAPLPFLVCLCIYLSLCLSLLFHPLPLSLSCLASLLFSYSVSVSLFLYSPPFPPLALLFCPLSFSCSVSISLFLYFPASGFYSASYYVLDALEFSLALPFAPCILISHLPRFLTVLSLSKCMHSDPSFYISVQLIYFLQDYTLSPSFSIYIYCHLFLSLFIFSLTP